MDEKIKQQKKQNFQIEISPRILAKLYLQTLENDEINFN
jgi:hypothetical protein